MSRLRRLSGNFAATVGGHFAEACLTLVVLGVSARYLKPELFGVLASASAFVQTFYFLADVGLARLLVREMARDQAKASQFLGAAIVTRFFLILLIVPTMALATFAMGSSRQTMSAIAIVTVWMILRLVSTAYGAVFQAFERMEVDSGLNILGVVARLGFTVGAIRLNGGLSGVLWAMVAGQALYLAGAAWVSHRHYVRPTFERDRKLWKMMLWEGFPIGVSGFFSTAYHQIDTLVLAAFRTEAEVGLLNGGYRIIHQLMYLPILFMRAPFPLISRLHRSAPETMPRLTNQMFKLSLMVGLPIGAALAVLAEPITALVLGKDFLQAAYVLRYYSWSVAVMFPAASAAVLLIAMDRQRMMPKLLLLTVGLNTALDLILVPRMGGPGACLATFVATAVMAVVLVRAVYREFRPASLLRIPVEPVLATCGLVGLLYLLRDRELPAVIAAGSAAYAVLAVILVRVFSWEELKRLRDSVRST
ncbi:MAG: flippase [Deltaproteobacteria bacterium]|nr:flippase [Deltaproteobacteria bacterium]